MATYFRLFDAGEQWLDANGDPYSGGKLYLDDAGTSTNRTSYKDDAGASAHTNPIVLDSAGRIAAGKNAYVLSGNVKITLDTSADVNVFTQDDYVPSGDIASTYDEWIASTLTPTFASTTTFTLVGDGTALYTFGRRIKIQQTSGTEYGYIVSSSFSSPTMTVTVALDSSAVVDSGIAVVSYGLQTAEPDGSAPVGNVTRFGTTQLNAAVTVGVNDAGHDVTFHGNTASANMLWDASADDLILGGAARVVVPASGLVIGSTAVTSTGAELNILDGVTSTAAELNILDGVTSTAAELNILDGVTSTAAELNILDGVTSTAAELNYSDTGAAVGSVVASKVVTVDANKDVASFRNVGVVSINGGVAPSHFEGKNRIDNPSGVVNQRGAQTGLTYHYFADRWLFGRVGTSAFNANTVSGYLEIDVTTADASIAAGDIAYMLHQIEGFNTSDLLIGTASAKTVTFSFKHKHTKTGIYCVAFHNSASDRNYIFEYTQSVSNTEETHAETVTLDTTGTWIGATNGVGLKIAFCFGSGSTYQGSADTWQAGNLLATSNQVNGMDSASNYFRITDVQLEVGTVATPLEYETYSQTLAKCQRYLYVLRADTDDKGMGLMGQNYSTTVAIVPIVFPVTPRAKITGIETTGADHFALTVAASSRAESTGVAFGSGGLDGIWLSVTVAANLAAGNAVTLWSANANAKIFFTGAEL